MSSMVEKPLDRPPVEDMRVDQVRNPSQEAMADVIKTRWDRSANSDLLDSRS